MKEALISILVLLATVALPNMASENGKDGFNFYKDYLRSRSEEGIPEGPVAGDRILYFYRTPIQLYPSLLPAPEQDYKKRTGNVFKNHMLSKEVLADAEAPGKRGSKTAISFLMQNKHPFSDKAYCPYGKRGWW